MDVDAKLIISLYKEKLSSTENELIMTTAQVIVLQQEIERLKNLLSENGIDKCYN